jgi:acylphosphatase
MAELARHRPSIDNGAHRALSSGFCGTAPGCRPFSMERHCIAVRGIVQGVGFRPFVHALASRHQLGGFVINDREGVAIEVEGEAHALECFERELGASPPPLARIDRLHRLR